MPIKVRIEAVNNGYLVIASENDREAAQRYIERDSESATLRARKLLDEMRCKALCEQKDKDRELVERAAKRSKR